MGSTSERTRQAILYVAWITRDDEHFGSIKLNKTLFRADFRSFFLRGRAITGARYHALENGPALVAMLPMLREMEAAGSVRFLRAPEGQKTEHRVIPVAPSCPATPLLDDQDREELDAAVERVRPLTARQASLLSHDFPGWEHAWLRGGSRTPIPYESVFWRRQNELTNEQEAWAREVAARHAVEHAES